MSDVAHILGVQGGAAVSDVSNPSPFIRRAAPEAAVPVAGARDKKKKMSRELAGILGKEVAAVADLEPMVRSALRSSKI